jgi:hypothetical protein
LLINWERDAIILKEKEEEEEEEIGN